jgi:exonuclease III
MIGNLGLSFACQNCNSLNMSHSSIHNQRQKIDAIAGLKTDVIFLSDLRLGNKNLTSVKGDIINLFRVNNCKSYSLISNSTRNKRGVGILISSDCNFSLTDTVLDQNENFIIIKIKINDHHLIMGSIYGPNEHDPQFFRDLYGAISGMGNLPVIIGGDFNCTFSKEQVAHNIDCLWMNDIPNMRHSIYLNEFCETLHLCDPFRVKYPTAKKFSYKPFGNVRKNRSRIDFFLASNNLVNSNFECTIGDSTLGNAFDHKPCFLFYPNNIIKKRGPKKLQISPSILNDIDIDIVAWYSIFETYLQHLQVEPDTRHELNQSLIQCGNVRRLLKDAGPDPDYYVVNLTEERLLLRDGSISEIKGIIRDNPIDLLYNFDLTISDDLFMEVLLNNFRNDVTSYQAFISKFRNNEKTALIKKISEEWELQNWDSVDILEDKLTKLNEQLLRDRLSNSNLFDILNNEKMTPMFLNLPKLVTIRDPFRKLRAKKAWFLKPRN